MKRWSEEGSAVMREVALFAAVGAGIAWAVLHEWTASAIFLATALLIVSQREDI